jgi:hypothetical protein
MEDFAAGGFLTVSCGGGEIGRGGRANGDVGSLACEFRGDGTPIPLLAAATIATRPCSSRSKYAPRPNFP